MENITVLSMDICSSTLILDDINSNGIINKYDELIKGFNMFFRDKTFDYPFQIYKYLGDGYIFFFEKTLSFNVIIEFVVELISYSNSLLKWFTHKYVNITEFPRIGITLGADKGNVFQLTEEVNTIDALNMKIKDPESCMTDIAKLISTNPKLSKDLLNLVNSAQYMLPKKVDDIIKAVKLVGLRTLKGILEKNIYRKIRYVCLYDNREFVGRPINVACRLESLLTNIEDTNILLFTSKLYNELNDYKNYCSERIVQLKYLSYNKKLRCYQFKINDYVKNIHDDFHYSKKNKLFDLYKKNQYSHDYFDNKIG